MTIDPCKFKAPFIPQKEAWAVADDIRALHWPSGEIPVGAEEVGVSLGLDLCPTWSLRREYDADAFLDVNLRSIIVDAGAYMGDRTQNRMRFSIAHEIGHYVLHREIRESIGLSSVDEWIGFMQTIPERERGFIEQHAYEFAGRLLVPSERLKAELQSAAEQAKSAGFEDWDKSGDVARVYVASSICPIFGVSSQVIEKRIIREQLWPSRGSG